MAGTPSTPQADPPAAPAGDGTDPEAARVRSLDDRFAAQDEKIAGLGGKLDTILGKLGGEASPKPGISAASGPDGGSAGKSIADQVREGVEKLEKERKQKADQQAAADSDAAWRKEVEERLPERAPQPPAPGIKQRIQRIMVGRPDQ